jgi:S-adenosylmethionine:tRNA ribosyltransferase-isomerase
VPTTKQQYLYSLPDEFIARFPLKERDQSKLLIYKQGNINHTIFNKLPDHLQPNDLLVFNNSKVIQARFFFYRNTGARIEVFLHDPVAPSNLVEVAMQQKEYVEWHCLIGNKKKWQQGEVLIIENVSENSLLKLKAKLIDAEQNLVAFSWDSDFTFAEIVQKFGYLPLPPYLNRAVESEDLKTYQTVYAKKDGAVAAPTAGLHFTENVLADLKQKGIQQAYLTLHVGAGTFKPVTSELMDEHKIHREEIHYTKEFIRQLAQTTGRTIAVGTTSMRSLETLYWLGLKGISPDGAFDLEQFEDQDLYNKYGLMSRTDALNRILQQMEQFNLGSISGHTSIYILPGYEFKICEGLITNFHMPGSTLLALVDAFVGSQWRNIYETAKANNYRFLSYGDSSLLWR